MRAAKPISASVQSAVSDLLAELHDKSGCEKIGLARESFAVTLCEVATKYLPASATHADARSFLLALRIEELALAQACAAGNNSAWELFLTRYREKLYQSALRIAREDSSARDLADSLYAELYGTTARDGERVSKLASFTGRGSLEGWLRTVLAQEFVNRYRRTLAEIARMLGVHESTISRKVDKLAKLLRKKIVAGMMQQGMARRQAEEALEVDVRDLQVDIRRSLAQDSPAAAFSEKKVQVRTREGSG